MYAPAREEEGSRWGFAVLVREHGLLVSSEGGVTNGFDAFGYFAVWAQAEKFK